MKILFPSDYSYASHAALRMAVSLARQFHAKLIVVHVEPPGEASPAAPEANLADAESGLVALLSSFGRRGEKAIEHEFRTLHGDPATEIARVSRQEACDLIVMATKGRTGLGRLVMGSVSEKVARTVECPVLTVKQPSLPQSHTASDQDAADIETKEHELSALALLERAIHARATDVHLDVRGDHTEVRFRIDGQLEPYCRLSREIAQPLVTQLKVMAEIDIADPFRPQEGRLSLPDPLAGHEVRLTRVRVLDGESIALRLLNRARLLRPLDTLGLSAMSLARVHEMLRLGEGIVLVTGPTGSGKTTTAYSMVHTLGAFQRSVVTIEDPPEYQISGFRQMTVDARHGVTMTVGLRNLLRMDPDVVLVGEIRDPETAEIAMRAASSGKYVFTTLHTRDVASTITAIRDLHIDNRSLAGNLTGIISQRLVRRLCPHCREASTPDDDQAEVFQREGLDRPDRLSFARGCEQCRNRGYHERIGVFEVVLPDRKLREAIEAGAPEDDVRDIIRADGTRSLLADGLIKASDAITSMEEVCTMTWAASGALPGDRPTRQPEVTK